MRTFNRASNTPTHRSSSRRKKAVAITLAAVLTMAGAGGAFAYWTSLGAGTATTTTGTSVAFSITSEPAVGTIAPGNAGQTVAFTVTNNGEGSQYLGALTVSIADESGVAWVPPAGCLFADYTAEITTNPAPAEIAAGGEVSGVVTVTLANTAVNQDPCKDAVVPLYIAAS